MLVLFMLTILGALIGGPVLFAQHPSISLMKRPRPLFKIYVFGSYVIGLAQLATAEHLLAVPQVFYPFDWIVGACSSAWWFASVVALFLAPRRLSLLPLTYLVGSFSLAMAIVVYVTSQTVIWTSMAVWGVTFLLVVRRTHRALPPPLPRVLGCRSDAHAGAIIDNTDANL